MRSMAYVANFSASNSRWLPEQLVENLQFGNHKILLKSPCIEDWSVIGGTKLFPDQ